MSRDEQTAAKQTRTPPKVASLWWYSPDDFRQVILQVEAIPYPGNYGEGLKLLPHFLVFPNDLNNPRCLELVKRIGEDIGRIDVESFWKMVDDGIINLNEL